MPDLGPGAEESLNERTIATQDLSSLRAYLEVCLSLIAETFVAELRNGRKGVYVRLGRRWGVGWLTARSRVMAAVRRGALIWTGGDHTPNGYLPAAGAGDPPPGSFEERLGLVQQWLEERGSIHVPRGTVYGGAKLRSWMDSQRLRYRNGTLTQDQIAGLEAIPGWWWQSPAPSGKPGHWKPA